MKNFFVSPKTKEITFLSYIFASLLFVIIITPPLGSYNTYTALGYTSPLQDAFVELVLPLAVWLGILALLWKFDASSRKKKIQKAGFFIATAVVIYLGFLILFGVALSRG